MNIKAYLKKHSITQDHFARQVGVSRGLVWQWLNGRTRITAEMAKEIEKKTEREIKREDLRPDIWERAA